MERVIKYSLKIVIKWFNSYFEPISSWVLARSPIEVFLLYLLTIFVFGCAYSWLSVPFMKDDHEISLSLYHAVYFSVVTITTLGYGDITPSNNLGMFMVGIESILGIVTLGLFLTSISIKLAKQHQEEFLKLETTMAIKHNYIPHYTTMISYQFSITTIIDHLGCINFPSHEVDQITNDEIERFKISIKQELVLIPIQLLKRITKDRKRIIEILDTIYAVSHPIINTKLKQDINKLKEFSLHITNEIFIEHIDDKVKELLRKKDKSTVHSFSLVLLSIKGWIENEWELIEILAEELNDISGLPQQTAFFD